MDKGNLIQIHLDDGIRPGLIVKVGRKFTSLIWADDRKPGVRVNKVPNDWVENSRPVQYHGKPYPLARAKKMFRKMGRSLGITKSARRALAG